MISIAIPTYEMNGKGGYFLEQSMDKLTRQTYENFEVVVSDHSIDPFIEHLCSKYSEWLDIKYHRNEKYRGSSSANLNNAVSKCNGDYVKILFQDDYLYGPRSLEIIASFKYKWLITGCDHDRDGELVRPFKPEWNDRILYGNNTLSSPSVVSFKRDCFVPFRDDLIWLMDCEWYYRMKQSFGKPTIIDYITVVNRLHEDSVSSTISKKRKQSELDTIYELYGNVLQDG